MNDFTFATSAPFMASSSESSTTHTPRAWSAASFDPGSARVGTFTRMLALRDRKGNVASIEDEVVFPSLLHAFAAMAARDLKGGFRLMTCAGCGALLRTNYHRTLYRSEQCRWKIVRRKQRAKSAPRKTGRKGGSR